jgi:DNA-binding CsgD family transcriptional regulator
MTVTTDRATDSPSSPFSDPALPPLPAVGGAGRLMSPVLVGRAAELADLRRAIGHTPTVIIIEGDVGVGKSRLVREWLADPAVAGTAQLLGHCAPLREPFPLGPVIDALADAGRWLPDRPRLSPVTGALHPLLPELSDKLPPPLEPLDNRRQERHRLFRAIRDLLVSIGPAVLVLEDLHEMDDGTRELLRFLVDRPPDQLTLVLTYRREDLADPHTPVISAVPADVHQVRLTLAPLDPEQVTQLAAAIDPRVPADVAAGLHELTAGIPLAVEEKLSASRDQAAGGGGRPLSSASVDRTPSALRDALWERIARLGGPARRLLDAAAVLGAPATEEMLVQVTGVPVASATAGLAELVTRALLRTGGDGRYGVCHPMAQRIVYESMTEPARRQLHRRAVKTLRATPAPPLAQLARHCRAAGQVRDWHRFAEAAADQALTRGDDRTASELLRDVVNRSEASRQTRVRLAIKLGWAALTGLSHRDAIAVLRRTLTEPELPAYVRGELRLCLGVLLRNQASHARQGRDELERAVQELAGGGPAARALTSLGAPYLIDGGHLEEHLGWLAKADRAAAGAEDPDLQMLVRTDRAACLVAIGDPRGWSLATPLPGTPRPDLPLPDMALPDVALPELAGVPSGPAGPPAQTRLAVNLAWAATCVGRYHEAGALLRTGERLTADTSGSSYLTCCLAGTRLLYDYAVGDWQGLATRAEEIVRTLPEAPSVVAEARLVLGTLALSAGDLREAGAQLTAVDGSVPVAVMAAAALARLAASSGDGAAATRWVEHGLDLVRGKGVWCWAAELIPIAVSVLGRTAGRQPLARKVWDEFVDGVAGRDSPLADAAVVAGRALLAEVDGEHLAAAAAHQEAAAAFRALPQPYAAAQATEARGRSLLAAGRDGTSALLEAMTGYERLGAARDVGRCRHLLRSLGRDLPHRRGRRGYGMQLSPRERDVVRLIHTGLTNREIADTLFLSPRTVEAHVARALRKLGLPSRRALASGATGSASGATGITDDAR